MRITGITARAVSVPLKEPFVISLATIDSADTVFVRVDTDCGITGYGEGAGIGFVTGETTDSVLGAVEVFTPDLIGQNPFAIDHLHRLMDKRLVGNGSAKAAVDLALYDIMARSAGLPLWQYLGGAACSVETDMTIGLAEPEVMAERSASLAAAGFRQIKVKAGISCDLDRAAITAIRRAAPHAHLKVDANQGWSAAEALAMIRFYAEVGVEAVEQPVPYWDLDSMAWLRDRSPIPIMADECCFTAFDASAIVRRGAADIINIKLMKCGGIYPALQINAIAEAAGVRCMLGCMLESRLGIGAGAHLVAARPNFVYADLDSFVDFDDSGLVEASFVVDPPHIRLGEEPGIGVRVAGTVWDG